MPARASANMRARTRKTGTNRIIHGRHLAPAISETKSVSMRQQESRVACPARERDCSFPASVPAAMAGSNESESWSVRDLGGSALDGCGWLRHPVKESEWSSRRRYIALAVVLMRSGEDGLVAGLFSSCCCPSPVVVADLVPGRIVYSLVPRSTS